MGNNEKAIVEVNMQFGANSFELKMQGQEEGLQSKVIMNLVRAIKTEGQTVDELKDGYQWMNRVDAATEVSPEEVKAAPEIKKEIKTEAEDPKEKVHNKHEVKYLEYGVKEVNGQRLYQLYYICDECDHRDKGYVPKGKVYGSCYKCGNRMRVRNASELGFHKDEFNNFYHAGKYKRSLKDLESDKKFKEESKKYDDYYNKNQDNNKLA